MKSKARTISSLIWVILLIVPPVRVLLEAIAIFLWPSASPFSALSKIHPVSVPLFFFVVIGYLLTYFALGRIFSSYKEISKLLAESPNAPDLRAVSLIVTLIWLVLIAITRQLSFPLFLIAFVALYGVIDFGFIFSKKTMPKPRPEPLQRPELEQVLEDHEDTQWYYRVYRWMYNEEPFRKSGATRSFEISLRIPKGTVEEYRVANHVPSSDGDYVGFCNKQLDDETVHCLAQQLKYFSATNRYDQLGEIHLAMAFSLSIPYHVEQYPKFPIETLVEKHGDCKDFSILCGTLLSVMGYKSGLVLMQLEGENRGHAAVGVVPPKGLPFDSYMLKANSGETLVYLEVTPTVTETTADTTDVQWYIGKMDWRNAYNLRAYMIG